ELLSGLAELYLRTDQPEKAATVLKRIVSDLPGTPYARRAQEWSATGDPKIAQCIGCHVE
ncbi:MAG: tetratricopeptide repeat protein, partial [Acidobacteria bacterium]|nr:tetratricopeptide repeat protein [Acidobacteriota bacterium]